MSKAGTVSLLIATTLLASCQRQSALEEEEPYFPLGFDTEAYLRTDGKVSSGETFTGLMNRCGMSASDAYRLAQLCDTVFDVRKLKAGNTYEAYYGGDSLSRGDLEYMVYNQDRIRSTIFKCRDSLSVWNYSKPVKLERKFSDITISSSLWNDMIASGASPALIMDLADIYQWSVNMFTLQPGDRFRVIYNQRVCEDEVISIDTVFFCVFNGGGKELPAVRFQTPDERGVMRTAYWGKGGESLKRMFLKAPLRYNRISSKFSYHRRHPVTGKVKAHTAVDYAAPTGTPVHSIGDGVVTLCGWDPSGGGNRIRIKHSQGYESCYMHLSKFAANVRAGSRVSQGQLIGYVGATGTATGPHLDFRIWHNKKPIDPLSLNSPASEPLDKKYLEDFEGIYNLYMSELDSLCQSNR
ncbi:MAG: M23 family metallopeptidase [Bacteroidales bacterium]|nr:M23 family metallopeptidase [Bacteroidales bacterium]